jgi:hypothetical protein
MDKSLKGRPLCWEWATQALSWVEDKWKGPQTPDPLGLGQPTLSNSGLLRQSASFHWRPNSPPSKLSSLI